jgi:hypothetical protein
MPDSPYPPYPPNMTVVEKVGGFSRTCLVIDLCTAEPLTLIELAQIEDKIGLVLAKVNEIYKADIVRTNRFVQPLRAALRLR